MDLFEVGRSGATLGCALRFHFSACDTIHFPAGKAGNTLRGAFGYLLDNQQKPFFEPSSNEGASGFRNRPRPFVLRAAHLDGQSIEAGSPFYFDIHLFGRAVERKDAVRQAFERMTENGLGPERSKVNFQTLHTVQPIAFESDGKTVERVKVRFITPTELKEGDEIADEPRFSVLAARIRDRISALEKFYGEKGSLWSGFREFSERASTIKLTRCDLRTAQVARRSSRTGRTHPIGGFVGNAEYTGDLTDFMPWLHLAYWTGVGRQTVWGKGVMETAAF